MARRTGLHSTSRSLAALVLSALVIPAAVLVVAVAERDRVDAAPLKISTIAPMPHAGAIPAGAAEQLALEVLPIVEGSSDAAGGQIAQRYAELDLADPTSALPMIDEAWAWFRFGPVNEFVAALALDEQVNNPDPSVDIATLDRAALAELRRDPSHARHVNDLAIALFALGIAGQEQFEPVGAFVGNGMTRLTAYQLLGLGVEAYPNDRTLVLNFAVVGSLTGDAEGFGIRREPRDVLAAYVRAHPDDVTPRLLLSYLLSRRETDADLEGALVMLEPLVRSTSTETIGHLARGDAMLAHAETRRAESPMLARRLARDSVVEYDEAATHGGAPDAYAGRALALDMLGDLGGAIEAQRAAVEAAPSSAAWWLRLAELQGCEGDQVGRDQSARAALDAAEETGPRLGAGRLIKGDRAARQFVEARGFGGYSLGSWRLPVGVIWPPPEGEGIVIDLDPFGTPPSCIPLDETDVRALALQEAMLASLAKRDAASARNLYVSHATSGEADMPASDLYAVANLLDRISAEEESVDALLAVQARLEPGVAGALCESILRDGSFPPATFRTLEVGPTLGACVAESAWRAGDEEAAREAMQRAIAMDEGGHVAGLRFLQAGMVAEATDAMDEAREAYRRAAADSDTIVAALARLGDLTLTDGNPRGAIAMYDLVLAVVDQGAGQDIFDPLGLPDLRAVVQQVRNNRGVARLIAADAESASGIECAADPEPCELAQKDVEAALASDPGSWIYRMNAGYVARLRGDDQAARRYLAEALTGEPSTAWAIQNDLGVLAAEHGAPDAARDHLAAAIAARPDYPLAPWNRGVLEASSGPLGFLAGQGWFADAARLQRSLRSAPAEYRFDEAVFRIELRRGRAEGVSEIPPPAGLAAATFASVAAVGSLARFGAALVAPGREAAMTLTRRALVGKKRRLRSAERLWYAARRLRISWSAWFVWLPGLLVLGMGIAYGAVRSAPDAIVSGLLVGAATIALALVTHQAGHRVVSVATGTRIRPARWDAGLITGAGALIFQSPTGPFPAEAIAGRDRKRIWLAALAGILANCAAAAVAYVLWWSEPLPVLRSLAVTQLLVAAYFLMPTKPLDGSRLEDHPLLTVGLGFAIAAASIALAIGVA